MLLLTPMRGSSACSVRSRVGARLRSQALVGIAALGHAGRGVRRSCDAFAGVGVLTSRFMILGCSGLISSFRPAFSGRGASGGIARAGNALARRSL